jgi:hypothetical protein
VVAFVRPQNAQGGEAVGDSGAVFRVDVCHELWQGEGIVDGDVGLGPLVVVAVVAPFFVDVDELLLEGGVFAEEGRVDFEGEAFLLGVQEIAGCSCDGFPCVSVEDGVGHWIQDAFCCEAHCGPFLLSGVPDKCLAGAHECNSQACLLSVFLEL